MATELWAIGLVISATLVGAFGPILLKKASAKKLSSIKSLMHNYYLMGGVTLYGIGTVLFIPALRGGDLSIFYLFRRFNLNFSATISADFSIIKECFSAI